MTLAVRRLGPLDTDRLFLAVCLVVPLAALLVFFLYPLATIGLRSITGPNGEVGLGNYILVLQSRGFWRAAAHSLVMSGAVTALSVGLGLVVAFAMHRCKVPGRAIVGATVALPLIAPSLVQGLGLIFLLGRNGLNVNLGAVVGIMLLLPTVLAFWLERVATQRQFGSISEQAVPLVPTWSPRRDVPLGLAAWLIALLPAAVVGVVVFASFVTLWPYRFDLTLRHYAVKVAGGYQPLWATVEISVAAALIGTALVFALGLAVARLPRWLVKPIYFICLLPASVPGLVLGLAYIFAFNVPGTPFYWLYGTAGLIVLCNVIHYWKQGFLTTMTGLRQ